ncbi:MAG: nucleotide pyrophosphohydrolase [Pirellulaceae bacterium]|jgi:NTP pyrophosphatase (non-canonical NTP hydrolase)|nr:nucleotide pyrophosphohydrolase [Planctomycetota bacterium]
MTDQTTTVDELRSQVAEFVAARQWEPFHTPKNLSMSLAIEAAELMEHFQWISGEAADQVLQQPQNLQAISEELADVICYALALANRLQIDVSTTLAAKMQKNASKYPVEEYLGRYGPKDQPRD